MELAKVIPQKVSFTLEKLGKTLTMGMITLDIDEWMKENYPGEELHKVLSEPNVKEVLKIAVKLLDRDSKKLLSKVEIIDEDEFGNDIKLEKLSLDEKLFRLTGEAEFTFILLAIFDNRKKSFDILDKIKEERGEKKTVESLPVSQNGTQSLT